MLRTIFYFGFFFSLLAVNESARILAWFPVPSISHQVFFQPITQELAKRGHKLTVITPNPAFPKNESLENLTEIDVHDISYGAWKKYFTNRHDQMADDFILQMEITLEAFMAVIDIQLNTAEMKDIINGSQKFDLLMTEACAFWALAIVEVLNVPVIQVSSFGVVPKQLEAFGAPLHPLLYPLALSKRTYNMTIWEKTQQLYTFRKEDRLDEKLNLPAKNILNKHLKIDNTRIDKLMKSVDLLLLNSLWSVNRPIPVNLVDMGGIHRNPKRNLPQDLQSYLDFSKHGVIYMSFGTSVDPSRFPPEKIQTFIKVFSKLPYDVLLKWNEDDLPGRSQNIRISKWLPQSDLLRHPNIKLFITQGGLQSTHEAITAAVPVIGIPVIVDQWYNVEQYVHHGLGIQLDIRTLDEEKLTHAIKTVIGDESYRKNMVKLRDIIQDQPMSALERAVWCTEHVLRHGGARHLRAPAAGMGWADYYELELLSFLLGALLVSVLMVVVALKYVLRFVGTVIRESKSKLVF